MTETEDVNHTACPSCGFVDSGNDCSQCGADLHGLHRSSLLHFFDSFLRFSEIANYVSMLARIIRSPTRRIIEFYESGNSRQAFQFLALSGAIYFLIGLSLVGIIREHDLIVGLISSLQFAITLTVSTPAFYKLLSLAK